MTRTVQIDEAVNANVKRSKTVDLDVAPSGSFGAVPVALGATAVASEAGDAVIHQTTITLTALAQSIADATSWASTKIYGFPTGRIIILGCKASLAPTTTSTIASTIKSGVAGAVALGSVATDSIALTGTEVDLAPSTVTANSTTINVAAAAVAPALAASAQFAGPLSMYLNSSVAAADIDGDGTLTWSGTVKVTWINLG
ncbi:MAG: hypothetical protein A3I66_01395 [Burkholderiales bacterium RIFCSPLOWO2_02_FULL_57_36]|nr:MAG: hypothetical protein A3I66_01395 [Burkholderiales bacterium RIFCSPLOWO2_02_FULL_57_36]